MLELFPRALPDPKPTFNAELTRADTYEATTPPLLYAPPDCLNRATTARWRAVGVAKLIAGNLVWPFERSAVPIRECARLDVERDGFLFRIHRVLAPMRDAAADDRFVFLGGTLIARPRGGFRQRRARKGEGIVTVAPQHQLAARIISERRIRDGGISSSDAVGILRGRISCW